MARTGFKLPIAVDNSDGTFTAIQTLTDQIKALAGLICWIQPQASADASLNLVTVASSKVAGLKDRAGLIADLAQSNAAYQPAYHSSGGPNNRPYMTGDGNDGFAMGNILPASGQPWTKVAVIRPQAEATTFRHIASSVGLNTSDGYHWLATRNTNQINHRLDIAPDNVSATLTYTPAAWTVVIASFDGTAKITLYETGFGSTSFTDADAGTRVTQLDVCLLNQTPGGIGGFLGDLAMFALFNGDYLASANAANLTKLNALNTTIFGIQ